MLQAIGGRMTEKAFELVLKNFDLDVRYPVSLCGIFLVYTPFNKNNILHLYPFLSILVKCSILHHRNVYTQTRIDLF